MRPSVRRSVQVYRGAGETDEQRNPVLEVGYLRVGGSSALWQPCNRGVTRRSGRVPGRRNRARPGFVNAAVGRQPATEDARSFVDGVHQGQAQVHADSQYRWTRFRGAGHSIPSRRPCARGRRFRVLGNQPRPVSPWRGVGPTALHKGDHGIFAHPDTSAAAK